MKPLHVYVAGPIGHGEMRPWNVRRGIDACRELVLAGHFPFTPHLHDHVDPGEQIGYETWMTFDFAWIRRCDALVRLPGKSPGADREVVLAGELGLPVFEGVPAFLQNCRDLEPRPATLEKSVISLATGEVALLVNGPNGEHLVCQLARSEARELMGQIGEVLK